jgi:hypothetical protein
MAIATILSAHFLYQATIVLLRMYASFLSAQLVIFWNIAKWMPTILSTLWVVTIRLGEGFFVPVACRIVSYLWTCLSCTCSNMFNGSGASSYVSHVGAKRELWVLSLCHWKMYIIIGIVGSALIVVFEHFDEFDKRTARAAALHRPVQHWAREMGHAASDTVEGAVPTLGVYNYSRAYDLNHRVDEKTNNEE